MTAALALAQPTEPQRLAAYLDVFCYGESNAQPLASVARQFGWSRRYCERVWLELRRAHGVYCSSGRGVFRAANRDELTRYRLQLVGRIDEQKETLRAVERELDGGPGQMELDTEATQASDTVPPDENGGADHETLTQVGSQTAAPGSRRDGPGPEPVAPCGAAVPGGDARGPQLALLGGEGGLAQPDVPRPEDHRPD